MNYEEFEKENDNEFDEFYIKVEARNKADVPQAKVLQDLYDYVFQKEKLEIKNFIVKTRRQSFELGEHVGFEEGIANDSDATKIKMLGMLIKQKEDAASELGKKEGLDEGLATANKGKTYNAVVQATREKTIDEAVEWFTEYRKDSQFEPREIIEVLKYLKTPQQ
jgi:hypothetical protein